MKLKTQHRSVPVRHELERGRSRRGVALVITLILLALITTLAIAFLGLTQRETVAVDSMSRTTDAELAADSALERAKAEILAVYPYRNQGAANGSFTMGPDMFVSACCHNYDTNNRVVVAYDRLDTHQRITNRYDSAPPVFVNTNKPGIPVDPNHPLDDRFYVDLNRNSTFEDTGHVPDTTDMPVGPGRFQYAVQAGNIVTNWRVGDPQWIGILRNPRLPHGPGNPYIARHAFMVLPAGRSLDVNWIHNDARTLTPPDTGASWYSRNQGVGGYELNFAAFLSDLNANAWNNPNAPYNAAPYTFSTDLAFANTGTSFADAVDMLSFRIGGSKATMNNLHQLFSSQSPANIDSIFTMDGIDSYVLNPPAGTDTDDPLRAWPGSDSIYRFHTPHDFLTERVGLSNRLSLVSRQGNSYDRFTYYRMLGQLGTDSAEESDEGKVNINFVNIRSWVPNSTFRYRAQDLISWTNSTAAFSNNMGRIGPELFFLTAVTNLLARDPELAFMVTNRIDGTLFSVPVFTNGATFTTNLPFSGPLYSARLHQLLQVVANIYDATTGHKAYDRAPQNPFPLYPYFPSVFRPWFTESNGNVFITDYSLVTDTANNFQLSYAWRDLESGEKLVPPIGSTDLVYGVPLIVGARKGYPNFSELGIATAAQATRKLTVYRSTAGKEWDTLEQQFSLQVRTKMQIEAVNSYAIPYQRPLEMRIGLRTGFQIRQQTNFVPLLNTNWITGIQLPIPQATWRGERIGSVASNNFVLSPVFETNLFNWAATNNADGSLPTNGWTASLINRMLFYLVDTSVPGGRIVDAVTLNRPTNYFEIGKMMEEPLPGTSGDLSRIWSSLKLPTDSVNVGIRAQLNISQNSSLVGDNVWGSYDKLTAPSKEAAATHFQTFMTDKNLLETNQAPFTPTRLMVQANYYQVSDPLVHYTFEDLRNDLLKAVNDTEPLNLPARTNLNISIGSRNPRTVTWNHGDFVASTDPPGEGSLDPTVRDPGLIHPEYWGFPTNLFPNVGWIGRVHRGTPWQTVYLKSRPPNQDWIDYTGNQRLTHPNAANAMQPARDWELLDVFTTEPHPNAARGRLSINQTNVAAWSAVFSEVVTSEMIDDSSNPGYTITNYVRMSPAALSPLGGATPSIEAVVTNINAFRKIYGATPANQMGEFSRLGQLLSAPLLTDDSPFLNRGFDARKPEGTAQVFDSNYEHIPQHILGLLKVGEPRFVIYSWGQSLKPARLGVQSDGGKIDLTQPLSGPSITVDGSDRVVNNYQVTGEVATKAVVRLVFPERLPLSEGGGINYRKPKLVVENFNVIDVE